MNMFMFKQKITDMTDEKRKIMESLVCWCRDGNGDGMEIWVNTKGLKELNKLMARK